MIKKAKKRKLKIMSVQKPVEDNTVQIIDYIPPTNNDNNNTIEILDNYFNSDDNSDDKNDNLKEQFMHKLSENPVIDIDNDNDDTLLLSKNKKNKSDIVIFDDDILQKEDYLYSNIFK